MNNVNKITVSICCITYNHELFIEQCIEGFLIQKCNFNFEVLIHDDASTDSTQKIIKEYQKKYPEIIKPIFQTENQYSKDVGGINARYNFSRAKGKYIALCEGDDYWTDPLKLQRQVDFLEENEEYVIHSAKAQVLKNGNLEETIGNPLNKSTYDITDFYTKNNLITCTILFKNIIPKFREINIKGLLFGDWMLYLQLLDTQKDAKAYVSNDVVSIYRIHSGGVTQSIKKKFDNCKTHFKQIIRINEYYNPKYSLGDIEQINDYAIFIAKQYIGKRQFFDFIKTIYQNYKLTGESTYIKKYLFLIRYYKQININ
ncbi:glycosyltransferase [Empedobacter brevis]|uniref:glycosyltransferase n=1 Tax=Empedobacter brevis TaxID=247 RepID=UPI0039B0550E